MAQYDVTVNIDLAKPIAEQGFGMPLLLVENASKAIAYTEVFSHVDVVAAGFEATDSVYKAAQLLFAQEHAPRKAAVCAVTTTATEALLDVKLLDRGWRQLIVVNGGDGAASTASALSAAVEGLDDKMLFLNVNTNDDTGITVSGLRRTVAFFVDANADVPVPVAALVGEAAGRPAGSFTYANMPLSGIAPQALTSGEINAIHNKGGITFVTRAGDAVTSEGKVMGGEYIDVIDSEDYVIQQIRYKIQKVMNKNGKVPYTNPGIAMLESAVVDVLQDAFNAGMIASKADGSPDYTVSFALREDTKPEDRAARHYPYGKFKFTLAGAIHTVEVRGEIVV